MSAAADNIQELRSTESDLFEKANRAQRLQGFIEEFGIQDCLVAYEQQLMKAMVDTKQHEDDARRHLRDAVHTMRFVKLHLSQILAEGKLSQADVDKIKAARVDGRKKFW